MTTNSPTNTNQASEEHLNNDKDLKQKLMALKTTDKALELGKLLSYKEIEAVMKVVSTHTQSKLEAFAEEVSELLVDQPIVQTRKPTHGNCCTCQTCGEYHDDCQCGEIEEKNEWKAAVRQALKAIKERWNV